MIRNLAPRFLAVALAVIAVALGWTPGADASGVELLVPMLGFIGQPLPPFNNVVASGVATLQVPRYQMTLNRIMLCLGGTTFLKSHITDIKLKLGVRTVYNISGTKLDAINKYKGIYDSAKFLTIDFTERDAPDVKSKEFGGYDLATIKDQLTIEVTISGATAPTLEAIAHMTPPQGNPMIHKLLYFPASSAVAGKFPINFNPMGAIVKRVHFFYAGTDWSASATSAAWTGNTGNGTMGAITVAAGTKVGDWKLHVDGAAANAGSLILEDPDGIIVGVTGDVATAFSGGGLGFTLADGSTDFLAGDGFTISVSEASSGNLNRLEVKKNGLVIWDYTCPQARFMAKEFRKVPQSKLYVYDPIVDNLLSGALVTADARSLEFNTYLTAADSVDCYVELLDLPYNA